MLGAIIGDIAGSVWEFNPTNNYDFEFMGKRNAFTDDSICTFGIADAMLSGREIDSVLHEWCRRYPTPMGSYGGRFAAWIRSDAPQPYGSLGNGSAMRVSPCGWLFGTEKEVLDAAARSAKCTHNHPQGVMGAQATALAIFRLREMRARNKEANGCRELTPQEVKGVIEGVAAFAGYDIAGIRLEDVQNKFDETCPGTVPVALWTMTRAHSFEDAVRQAVALGADADTLGAIVGGMAEAAWDIDEETKRKAETYLTPEMLRVLEQFRQNVREI